MHAHLTEKGPSSCSATRLRGVSAALGASSTNLCTIVSAGSASSPCMPTHAAKCQR
jgi:hypothetical protein